ncbi:MAG: aminotransferase class III-fold pyridoxal phosphate-dependent enzyme [Woeseiaceae bacterium]|nr:aminotransferase class III-fold pyridoxal phosphate-dependent enzyme [Woeseiaceae bacterium]
MYGSSSPSASDPAVRTLIERRNQLLGPYYRLFYDEPVHVVRGEDVWLFDDTGERYLDAYNNVACVGHCHPRVVDILAKQAATLNTHTRYLHTHILDYAESLLSTLPNEIGRLTLTCTGTEANDLALRIANNRVGGRAGIVVTDWAYHGGSVAVAEITPCLGIGVGEHVRTVPAPDSYRCDPERLAAELEEQVTTAFADLRAAGYAPGAFVFDSIFSSDGVFAHPAGVLVPACDAARRLGALVVADEVQAGFARTGDAFWGFERHGIVPDIVTMGKPMGNGHPIAGLAARPEVLDAFADRSRHFNTFGGNPVSCAVGQAVLDIIVEEGLQENARATGDYLRAGLSELAGRHALIGDVRGAGLFTGCELVTDREPKTAATDATGDVVNALRARNVLVSRAGRDGNTLKIRPPLTFRRKHADLLVERLDDALTEVASA